MQNFNYKVMGQYLNMEVRVFVYKFEIMLTVRLESMFVTNPLGLK